MEIPGRPKSIQLYAQYTLHCHKNCTMHIHSKHSRETKRKKNIHLTASECAATQKFIRVMGEHEKMAY